VYGIADTRPVAETSKRAGAYGLTAVVLERYAGARAKPLTSLDGFLLGLNAGVLYGEWLGFFGNASAFPGLTGALVWSLGFLELYERIQ